jgi:hypothetical protein
MEIGYVETLPQIGLGGHLGRIWQPIYPREHDFGPIGCHVFLGFVVQTCFKVPPPNRHFPSG